MTQTAQNSIGQAPDYFSLFDLGHHLRIDNRELEKSFYARSRRLHPDRFAARPAADQEAALAAASDLNDAYRTLKDPILRTGYLLALEGIEIEEQSKAATDAARASGREKKQAIPPELLEEVFELNMQLMEMKAARQMGDEADPALLNDLRAAEKDLRGKLDATTADLEKLWKTWDEALDAADLAAQATAKQAMVALLNRRNYLNNLVRDVTAALEG